MEYPTIDIKELSRYKHAGYLTAKASELEFLNQCLGDAEAMTTGIGIAERFLDDSSDENEWRKSKKYIVELTRHPAISTHISKNLTESSPRGKGMETEILFSYCVGEVAKDKKDAKWIPKLIRWLLDADWTGFSISFLPSENYLKAFISSDFFAQDELLDKIGRRRGLDIDSIEAYFSKLSLDEKLRHVTSPMFEGEFYMLYEYLDFLTVILLRNRRFDLMTELLDRYSLPEIHYEVIQPLKNPDDYTSLFQTVAHAKMEEEKKRLILQIILSQWLNNLIRIKSDYSVSLSPPHDSAELHQIWNSLRREFENHECATVAEGITIFLTAIPPNETALWLFTVPYPNTGIENEYNKAKKAILDCTRDIFLSITKTDGFDSSVRDLSYLGAYAEYADKILDEVTLSLLSDSIIKALHTDRYYLLGDLTDELIGRFHPLSQAIVLGSGHSAGQLFDGLRKRFSVNFSASVPSSTDTIYYQSLFESQFLMVILYAVAFNQDVRQKEEDFLTISTYLLNQCRSAGENGILDRLHYHRVLFLAEMMASQVMPKVKEKFDLLATRLYPDFYYLLQVFNRGTALSPSVIEWLEARYSSEWPATKALMETRGRHDEVEWVEKAYKALTI